jgi:acyl-CoA hydrolase
VDYVVTEYGIAHLQGKTLRQRADELISIAHPDFRSELKKQAHKMLWP